MSVEDRVRWDDNYRKKDTSTYPGADPLLKEFTPPLEPNKTGRALDLAAGLGQNGLWLAEQGYRTDVMDISRIALNRARSEMAMRNIRTANLLQIDLDTLELEANTYDVICVFRYLKRELFPQIKAATKPGGRVIYQTFNMQYLYLVPGFNREFLLKPRELIGYFPDWQILHDEEEDHISYLVAVKPV